MLELVIGNKNYSSWSLRPWVLLKALGIAFREIRIPLFEAASQAALAAVSPSGRVPVLRDDAGPGGLLAWESLAICETIAERAPRAWPADARARAHARSVSHEMHAGFAALRAEFPLNCRARRRGVTPGAAAARDIARIRQIWADCRDRHGAAGPWLFGGYSIADAMYAPVVFRFATYGIDCPGPAGGYAAHALASAPMQEWLAGARAEREVIAQAEIGEPAD
jgi:glutathione S-transferase